MEEQEDWVKEFGERFAANKIDFAIRSNKWEGEDEDEEVKDSWEDVEEEKKDVEKQPVEAPKVKNKPKKSLAEKIEERERKAREEAERKAKEKEQILTPDEKRAELLRQQRLQEEADLRLAMDTFGVTDAKGIDAMIPDTKEEFEQFGETLISKICTLNKHTEFPTFAEELIKNISVQLSAASLRKVKTMVDNLAIEKGKLEKGDKKKKGKGKAKLRLEGENTIVNEYDDYGFDNEYDEFM